MGTRLEDTWGTRSKKDTPMERPDTLTIKMPAGTKKRFREQARVLEVSYGVLLSSALDYGLHYHALRAARAKAPVTSAATKPTSQSSYLKNPTHGPRCGKWGGLTDHRKKGERLCDECSQRNAAQQEALCFN